MLDYDKLKIKPETPVADIAMEYPEVADVLVKEYGFHCTNCFLAEFETLVEGAMVHGIEGEEFDEVLMRVNDIVDELEAQSKTDKQI